MDTSGVSGPQPIYGVHGTHRDRPREKGNREAFERAFREHAGEEPEEDDVDPDTPQPAKTALQPRRPVIRKGPQDGEFHVDILA